MLTLLFDEQQKNEIHLFYLFCFYIVFVHYLLSFGVNKQRREVINWRVCYLRSTVTLYLHLPTISLNEPILDQWGSYTDEQHSSVVHRYMNLISPKLVHLRKLSAPVNILRNEFHFSEVYRSVNYIESLAKWMNPKGVHVNFVGNPLLFTLR